MPAPATASAGASETVAPSSASGSAFERVRFHTRTSSPARSRFCAIGAPMIPVPSTATVSLGIVPPGSFAPVLPEPRGSNRHPAAMEDLVEETIALGGRDLRVLRPRDAEALLDEEAFEHEEFLPYWAELWPSGVALARHVAGLDLAGARVLEVGCGLALPGFAAALAGASALATDWAPDAIELARGNAERNGIELELAVAAWSRPQEL